jgi:sugar phosphate permease
VTTEPPATLLPGGRPVPARLLYLVMRTVLGFLNMFAFATYGLYVVREANLTALELILVGTALELSAFLFEVPTGVVADVYSRRLSVVLSLVFNAVAFVVMGAVASFTFVFAGSFLWGFAFTFRSGALEAWLADEIGEDEAGRTYGTAQQFMLAGQLTGIPFGVAVATIDLQLPIVISGLLFGVLAVAVALLMTERGFVRHEATGWSTVGRTAAAGIREVRGRPALVAVMLIAVIAGASSESLDRLNPLLLIEEVGLPGGDGANEALWFGLMQAGAILGAIGLTNLAGRFTDPTRPRGLIVGLLLFEAVLIAAMVLFGTATLFVVALTAYLVTGWVRAAAEPLTLAWINRGLDPRSRATVLSLHGQSDALGLGVGGPVLGVVATFTSVRVALVTAGLILLPALPIFARQLDRTEEAPTAEVQD